MLTRPNRRGMMMGNPWRMMDDMMSDMQLFRDNFMGDMNTMNMGGMGMGQGGKSMGFNCDLMEYDDKYEILCDLPGVKKEDIDMNMKGNMLEIHCRRPNPCDESMMMMKGGGMEHHQGKESMEKEHEMEMGQAPERKEEESKEMQMGKTSKMGGQMGGSKMGGGKMHMKCPKMRMCERFYGEMMRSFQMPDDCDMNNVKACCQDGVLKICMSKMEKHKPQKIAIE